MSRSGQWRWPGCGCSSRRIASTGARLNHGYSANAKNNSRSSTSSQKPCREMLVTSAREETAHIDVAQTVAHGIFGGGFAHNVEMLRFSASSSSDAMWRLPRHPDWKYEMVKGEAWLSSRPRPLHLCRPTSLAVGAVTLSGVELRTISASRDRSEIAKLLMDVWVDEDPYRSLEDPKTLLQEQIQRSLEDPGLGVVAIDEQGVCAVVLVPSMTAPELMWLTVRREARERGL